MLRYKIDEKNRKRVLRIIKRYPEEFGFIDPRDVLVVQNIWARNSRAIATASLVPAKLEPVLGTKIIVEVFACHWRKMNKAARLMVLYHELMHIVPNERDTEYQKPYTTQTHDVQEFGSLIARYGAHWERSDKLPNLLKEHIKVRRPGHKLPVMG